LESILPVILAKIKRISKSETLHIISIMDYTMNHLPLVTKYCKLPNDVTSRLGKLHMYEELFVFLY